MNILFIHRSVGHNLIKDGDLRTKLATAGHKFDDYDNNSGVLTLSDSSHSETSIKIPGNNTNPDNLAKYFAQWDPQLDSYDLVMIKSCYPNSHIKSDIQLESIKQLYLEIFTSFRIHNKNLLLLTTPPLRPFMTNHREAELALSLSKWLMSQSDGLILIFDFHSLLSESSGQNVGMLKKRYRRLFPTDNHPNKTANTETSTKLVAYIRAFDTNASHPT